MPTPSNPRSAGKAEARSPRLALKMYYRTLYSAWGRPHWWPARSRFEVIVGAYLTQNTAWRNVEAALRCLRRNRLLTVARMRAAPLPQLQASIRSAGYYRQKAQNLKIFIAFLDESHGGSLQRMFAQPTAILREQLLELRGVGPETADSILLYAGQHPVFVVDAYTRRILERHHVLAPKAGYEQIRELLQEALRDEASPPRESARSKQRRDSAYWPAHSPSPMSRAPRSAAAQIYSDMHGLIVGVGKHYCRSPQPRCQHCPLRAFLAPGETAGVGI